MITERGERGKPAAGADLGGRRARPSLQLIHPLTSVLVAATTGAKRGGRCLEDVKVSIAGPEGAMRE